VGKQASVAAAVTGAAVAGAGAGAGAGVGAATGAAGFAGGVAAADVVLGESLLEELLEPQPVIAKMNKNPSGANAPSALNRYPIATCSQFHVIHTAHERLSLELTQTALGAVFGNPAICHSQTGSFASPACAGYALERIAVKHVR
jgi:hypothetical protein